MKFITILLILVSLVIFSFAVTSVKKEKVKKPKGLLNSVHDTYVKCKEECRKIEEREVTEKYIQYLRSELEVAEIVAAQEQLAAAQTNTDVKSEQSNIDNSLPSEEEVKDTFVQEENLIV
uniref:Transmembrane protein n=1 Tax=Parastrongyloides trichosuri TaxID=131310 RepID=A0A0N4ZHF8_PARTI